MVPLLLALVVKKVEYDALSLENCMPNSSDDKMKKVRKSSPSTSNPMMAMMSRSMELIVAKGKINPFMEVAQNLKRPNIKVVLIGMSC